MSISGHALVRLRAIAAAAFALAAASPVGLVYAAPADIDCRQGQSERNDKQVYWGDLHVHTSLSLDAYVFGNRRLPEDAYQFARGAPEVLPDGSEVRLERPLDFAAVTDHAEYLAATEMCGRRDVSQPYCAALNAASEKSGIGAFREFFNPPLMRNEPICPAGAVQCGVDRGNAWKHIQRAAEEANEPCRFTTFVANEWSASPSGLHWHRNLIFANDVVPDVPVNSIDEPLQEDMWRALAARCDPAKGCDVLAIPHNSNLGMGGTFRLDEADTVSLGLRARFERLAEIHQHKGQSECLPGTLLSDEACAFEIEMPTPVKQRLAAEARPINAEETTQVASGYLRAAVGQGLVIYQRTGINPFQFGFIGSTDTHGARPGYVKELNWRGTFSRYDATDAGRANTRQFNPGGLVAVWATQNTRAAIFDALRRREVFATSGPRIRLRFQQSFDAALKLCAGAAAGAVQMGGTIAANATVKPRFSVQVLKDQRPIARVDIVRLAYRGERIVQEVTSHPVADGSDACVEWTDTLYDAALPTLWYARVLEVPSPRWIPVTADAKETYLQERAWSSPIWSMPQVAARNSQ